MVADDQLLQVEDLDGAEDCWRLADEAHELAGRGGDQVDCDVPALAQSGAGMGEDDHPPGPDRVAAAEEDWEKLPQVQADAMPAARE